jgi:hypothetical protein
MALPSISAAGGRRPRAAGLKAAHDLELPDLRLLHECCSAPVPDHEYLRDPLGPHGGHRHERIGAVGS